MNNATILAANPYDQPPPLWRRYPLSLTALGIFVLTVVPTVLMFPPYNVGPLAYMFAAPAILWAYRKPPFKVYAWTVLGAQAVAWTILLAWLHNVTWVGLFLLGPFVGAWVGSWFLLVRALVHRMPGRSMLVRILSMLALAGAWVLVEWTRTWFLSGFPWLTLAISQWEHPSILQIAAFTGAGGVSFVLIAMNIGVAAYAHRLMFENAAGLNRRSQEFFAALFLLLVCLSIHVQETYNRVHFNLPFARVGFVQPHIPQDVKWDPARATEVLGVLERTTLGLAARRPDFVLWPEAVTPMAVKGDPTVQAWTEALVRRLGAPLLLGSIGVEPGDDGVPAWRNGAFLVEPEEGLAPRYYTKRRLVPFGEFVPLRPVLGWLEKVVPVGGDFEAGLDPTLLIMRTPGGIVSAGPLICYEDVFPQLARRSTRAGADLLVVLTNNGWFGEGGAATQHAAHSVLRAIETRRPVLRCGNGGWSGWIDEFGSVRAVLRRVDFQDPSGASRQAVSHRPADEGTIYFRGATTVDVTRDHRWVGRDSFYVRNGDWFVVASLGILILGGLLLLSEPKPAPAPDGETAPEPPAGKD